MFTTRPLVYYVCHDATVAREVLFCSTVWGVLKNIEKTDPQDFDIKIDGVCSFYCFLIAARHQSNFEVERHSCFLWYRWGRWSGG